MKFAKLSFLLITFSLLIAACGTDGTSPTNIAVNTNSAPAASPSVAATPDELAAAKELYALNCMICHKDSGKGGKVTIEGKVLNPDDLTSEKMKAKTDEKLIGYVTDGVEDEGMPSFKGKLTEDEIKSVVKHVRLLQSK
ncbi:MAG: cytochrome c [Pyrinomonadaceae bacterium]